MPSPMWASCNNQNPKYYVTINLSMPVYIHMHVLEHI